MKNLLFIITLLFNTLIYSQSADILLNGTVSAESNQIKNVTDPTEDQDAATKNYTDQQIQNLQDQISLMQNQISQLQSQGFFTDQNGNIHVYLTYGNQVWTLQSARVITYRDGTPIPQVTDPGEWASVTTGAWCYFDNDSTKGILYNWYAVAGIHDNDSNTPNKELAPEGWHVPSLVEWTSLENFLITNGFNYDGTTEQNKITKSMASTTGWYDISSTDLDIGEGDPGYDQLTNNSSAFNAFPTGGRRYNNSNFFNEGIESGHWSSTESTDQEGKAWQFHFYTDGNYTSLLEWYKNTGWSVRFVKD